MGTLMDGGVVEEVEVEDDEVGCIESVPVTLGQYF